MKIWLLNYAIVILIGAAVAYLFGFIIKVLARKIGAVDTPTEKKIHKNTIPRLGGIAIFCGFAGSLVIIEKIFNCNIALSIWVVLLGALVTMIIGAADDLTAKRGGVSSVLKLIILFGVTYVLSLFGIIVDFPFPYFINLIITLIWLVAVVSAFNAMDNMDGLASGLALIAGLTFLAVAIQTGQWNWGFLAAALVGANLGFLRHNFYPAKIFMGDSGSFFLGFTLGAMGIMGAWSTNPFKASFVPIIILGLPLFDLVYIIIKRYRQGKTKNLKDIIVYSGQDHFSHRIKSLGLTQRSTVGMVWLISLCLSFGAYILRNTKKWEAILLLLQFLLVLAIFIILMELANKKKA